MIRRARRDGREARRNEEKERMRKGAIVSSSPSGYYKLELKHQNLVFSSLECLCNFNVCGGVVSKSRSKITC